MGDLPTGTVTFLFTDVEGSTRAWEQHPAEMGSALTRHDEIIEAAATDAGGTVVRPRGEGDSRFCVFARASDAVAAATSMQRALRTEPFVVPIVVRAAVHTGEADLRAGDYYGPAVNRAARLRALAHGGQTLVSVATQELVGGALPEGVHLEPLGAFRLKDLTRIENVFQLCHPDLPEAFPALLSLDALPNNLPLQLTSFVGRDDEVATVVRLLGEARLVTLNGAGGCGKTRLALHAAAEMLDAYPDGVWFADLAPITDPDKVVPVIAAALSAREEVGRELIDLCVSTIGDRRVLLILDNCEHLLDDAAGVASDLLHRCPQLRVLATGREPLGVPGETTWRVPSLSLPDATGTHTLEELTGSESARLFVYRARAVAPDLALTDRDAPAISQICHRLGGIALALELAAARADVLTCEQIAGRLDDSFRLLTGGSRTSLERQQTLRATLDWSYALLGAPARALFARLSVFNGGFTLEAAEEVCAGGAVPDGDVLDLVSDLVRKSLVVLERLPGRDPRYRLLETMRQYARERLRESDDGSTTRDRHAAWYGDLADRAFEAVSGPDQIRWLRMLDDEHENLRSALDWVLGPDVDPGPGIRLAGGMGAYWMIRGVWTEGRQWLARVLARPGGDPGARARALTAAARLALSQGDAEATWTALEDAEAAALASGDETLQTRAFLVRALAVLTFSSNSEAAAACADVEGRARANGDLLTLAFALNGRALCSKDVDARLAFSAEAVEVARAHGDLRLECMVEANIAFLLRLTGELARAQGFAERALATAREIGDKRTVGICLGHLSSIAFMRGDAELGGAGLLSEMSQIVTELGGSESHAHRLLVPALRSLLSGDLVAARETLSQAKLATTAGTTTTTTATCAYLIAEIDFGLGAPGARKGFEEARDAEIAHDDLDSARATDQSIAWLDLDEGLLDAARPRIIAALEVALRWHAKIQVMIAAGQCGALALAVGEPVRAATFFGAREGLRAEISAATLPWMIPRYERYHAAARAAAGDDFDSAWSRGLVLPWDEASNLMLEWLRST